MIERLPLFSVLAGCALFAGILVAEISAVPAPETEAAGAAPPRAEPSLPPVLPEVSSQYDAMVATIFARPLFSPTRRPSPRNDGPAADSDFADTRLAGIVTEPGHRFAIFAPSGAKPLVVSEGDTVSGWRVDSINPREVSLSGPGGTKTLQPKIDPNLVPPTPAPLAAATPPSTPPISPAAVRPGVRPGIPPALFNRAPFRPGQFRERR
jgi:general secretion pathway protein N